MGVWRVIGLKINRTCYKCNKKLDKEEVEHEYLRQVNDELTVDLTYLEFFEKYNEKLNYFKRLWNSEIVEFLCCNCLREECLKTATCLKCGRKGSILREYKGILTCYCKACYSEHKKQISYFPE